MKWSSMRENLEALTVALLLALVIRHFFIESYEIPTGSMASDLNGLHITADCPNCSTPNHVGISSDSLTNRVNLGNRIEIFEGICPENNTPIKIATSGRNQVTCPSCKQSHSTEGTRWARASTLRAWCRECTYIFPVVVESTDILGGNKILVDKFIYDWQQPKRWDVVVFKFNRERNYIKRLVGLPGEKIQVVSGDVWIDGNIESKTIEAQENFWTQIHDSSVTENGLVKPAWNSDSGWQSQDDGSWDFNQVGDSGQLAYTRPIRNRYNYNPVRPSSRPDPVRDVAVRAKFHAARSKDSSSAGFHISIHNYPSEYRCSLPFGEGAIDLQLIRPGEEPVLLGSIEDSPIVQGQQYLIEAQIVDRRFRIFIDGDSVADIALPPSEQQAGLRGDGRDQEASSVTFSAQNCGGKLHSIELFRDLHWTQASRYATSEAFEIGADRYFVLGDNSPSSLDSRWWGSFSRTNLLGRGFAIFWPALPGRNESGFIR